jgi:ACS family hexuronate transporter-like MFS transporter
VTSELTRTRIIIVVLLGFSAFLNYLDRQALAILATPIQADLSLSQQDYAFVVSAFLVAYSGGNLVTGWLLERFGARLTLPAFVLFWSAANFATGLVVDVNSLAATRFALGVAEIGGFLALTVIGKDLFPPKQRASVMGWCNAAAMFGATAAPPLIAWIYGLSGWRFAFLSTGVIGFLWAACWLLMFHRPANYNAMAEAAEAAEAALPSKIDRKAPSLTWVQALTSRRVWAITCGKMFVYPVWYFYLFWFPKYLTDERGLTIAELGRSAWVVYAAAGVGSVVGGMASGYLIQRGKSPATSRLIVMAGVALIGPFASLGNGFGPPILLSLMFASMVGFVQMIWQVNIIVLATDLFSSRQLGKVIGVAGFLTGLAGVLSNQLVGALVETVSYRPMFIVMAGAYPVAMIAVLILLREPRVARAINA